MKLRAESSWPVAGCQAGVTLIELMITLVVAVVLLAMAVPSFRSITLSSRLNTAANEVVAAVNAGRVEAIKRNASAQLCSNDASTNGGDTLGTACGTETGAVYLLIAGAATKVGTGVAGLQAPIRLKGNLKALRFGGDGLAVAIGDSKPYAGQVADICTDAISTNNHRIVNMTAGSSLSVVTSSGACP
ncbi:pilus assembly FimT family protein [Aerosticca soli]|uniref:pilus assembly FimT family protein n=1 Tax=Aerosticca soli TaxID=2010829 RepID=UPI000F84A1F1|nr:GspH/FimT family pseudopilin [Aerosticca soli]